MYMLLSAALTPGPAWGASEPTSSGEPGLDWFLRQSGLQQQLAADAQTSPHLTTPVTKQKHVLDQLHQKNINLQTC